MGWMSPEEIEWDNNAHNRRSDAKFEAHLSADVHSAGSLVYYILTGGKHCFGPVGDHLTQQTNIVKGFAVCDALANPVAVDMVTRMVYRRATARLKIVRVLEHPLWWGAVEYMNKVCEWKSTWRRSPGQLKARIKAHRQAVRDIVGDEGWLVKLDAPVATALGKADGGRRGYDGDSLADLLRAIRNIYEHWYDQRATHSVAALRAITGWSKSQVSEMRGSKDAHAARAETTMRYFFERFPRLVLIFEFERAASSDGRADAP